MQKVDILQSVTHHNNLLLCNRLVDDFVRDINLMFSSRVSTIIDGHGGSSITIPLLAAVTFSI